VPGMGTKSREVIWGSTIRGAKMSAETACQRAKEAAREADRQAHAWSVRMEGYGGPAQPSPTIGQCIHGGMGLTVPLLSVEERSPDC
jgi:hypothetical protein